MKLIDKDALVAEIERRIKCFKNERNTITKASDNNLSLGARIAMCEEILSFINSMKEEPVSEELEKAAVETFKKIVDSNKNSFLEIFKAGAQWQKEQMLKTAFSCEIGKSIKEGKAVLCGNFAFQNAGDKVKMIIVKED